jgi:hypothetical protein
MGTTIILVLIAIAALAVWLVITRGLQLKQLVEDGIDTEGKVIRQFKRNPKKASLSTDFYLRYAYRDRNGIEHEYKSNVNRDFWAAHPEGSAIAITYSKSRPGVSAPRFLVDAAREAMAKKTDMQ